MSGRVSLALAVAVLVAALGISVAKLPTDPAPFDSGDESWISSEAWSFTHGHGLRPAMAGGDGVYDGGYDYWSPRLGMLPLYLTAAVGPTSRAAYRASAFVIGLIALALFAFALARVYGWPVALAGAGALTLSWGFYTASHLINWDAMAFLAAIGVMAVLLRGAPGPRAALGLGLLLGAALDVQLSVLAAAPGVALLVGWEPRERWRRLGLFAGGLFGVALLYLAIHTLPHPDRARDIYQLIYEPGYKLPLLRLLDGGGLGPDELDRYRWVTASQSTMGVIWLSGAAAGLGMLALALRRPGRPYPVEAVPGILLLSHLAALFLIQANKEFMYGAFATPYALAALIAASWALSARWEEAGRAAVLVGVLAALTVWSGVATIRDARAAPDEPTDSPALARNALSLAGPDGTVMGEPIYWWAFRGDRYRFNMAIWLLRNQYGLSLEQAFDRLCPRVVLLDDIWRLREIQQWTLGSTPPLEPTDPSEGAALMTALHHDYRERETVRVGTHPVELWQRAEPRCGS